MRIGIDFDNTIVCYDGVFHAAALERELISKDVASDKNAVRDYLNASGQNEAFTELQGYVYGARMSLAAVYPGVRDFISEATEKGHRLFIISHKTKYPIAGPRLDMHKAARDFLAEAGLTGDAMPAIASENVYFAETKDAKIARASVLKVDAFIDDLPEILAMPGLDDNVHKVLFDPQGQHHPSAGISHAKDWGSIASLLLNTRGDDGRPS